MLVFYLVCGLIVLAVISIPAWVVIAAVMALGKGTSSTGRIYRRLFFFAIGLGLIAFLLVGVKSGGQLSLPSCVNC